MYDMQARDTFVLLRNEEVNSQAEEVSSDVAEKQGSSFVEDTPVMEHLSDSNDVIHSSYLRFRRK